MTTIRLQLISLIFCLLPLCGLPQAENHYIKTVNDMMAQMREVKMSGSFDADFARLMVEHHQGAINLAQSYVRTGTDQALKEHAQQLITKRKKEQQQLEIFTKAKGPPGSKDIMPVVEKMMTRVRSLKSSGDLNQDYVLLMLAHLDAGIEMSNLQASRGQNAALKKMAADMAEGQRHSRERLQQWLANSVR